MIIRRDQTSAFRMRQLFRAGELPERVEPKYFPLVAGPTTQPVASSRPAEESRRCAAPEQFADKDGLSAEYVLSLVDQGKIAHLELPNGELRIKVKEARKIIDGLFVRGKPKGRAIDAAA